MTIDEIKKRLSHYRMSKVAQETGLTTQTLRNIVKNGNTTTRTMEKLTNYFRSVEGK